MINIDELRIDQGFWQGEDESRIQVLQLLLAGYSNNCIADELSFSLKNIESIISKLFRRSGIITRGGNSSLINPRVKLLVDGLNRNWLQYRQEDKSCPLDFLTRNQYLSLLLCAAGISNKALADFLCISSKTVESRLNTLFHLFAVNVQTDHQINPRVRLIVSAINRRVLSPGSIIQAARALDIESWPQVLNERENIKDEFLRYQLEAHRAHLLQPSADVSTIFEAALAQSSQNFSAEQFWQDSVRQSTAQPLNNKQPLYGAPYQQMPQPAMARTPYQYVAANNNMPPAMPPQISQQMPYFPHFSAQQQQMRQYYAAYPPAIGPATNNPHNPNQPTG